MTPQTPQQQQQQGAPQVPRDLTDNASLYPMMNQIYKEFDHLSPEEQKRIQSMFAAAVQNREKERQMEMEMEDSDNQVKKREFSWTWNMNDLQRC